MRDIKEFLSKDAMANIETAWTEPNEQANEQKATTDDIIEQLDNYDANEQKKTASKKTTAKKKYLSWEFIKTDWWWRWEWERDEDWYPILRKETKDYEMYHLDKATWVYEVWEWKDAKQYNVWNIKSKKDWKEFFAYKKDWNMYQVRFIKKPFDLANRLYITGHAYQQKWQSEPQD